MFIGRVEKIKGLNILLDAFAELSKETLVVAGTGPQLEEYRDRATDNVQFVGFLDRDRLSQCLSKAKAVIVPSQCYEQFGMVIVEAYAAHKPVITGDIGNIASLVEEGITGLHFDYDSPMSLKDVVNNIENMDIALMGANAYRKYRDEFTAESNYNVLKAVYDSVAKT